MKKLIEMSPHPITWYEKVKTTYRPRYDPRQKYYNAQMSKYTEKSEKFLSEIEEKLNHLKSIKNEDEIILSK